MVLDFYNQPKKYYEGFESFCYQNCLKLILDAAKISYAPLYTNASLSMIIDIKDKTDEIVFGQNENARTLLPPYSDQVKRYYYDSDADPKEIFTQNIRTINLSGNPIVVGVDVFYLPYTPYYHKNHAIHTQLLCGFEAAQECVYITDWYEPWFFNGTIPKSEFLRARNSDSPYDGSIYSGTPILNNWAEIQTEGLNASPEELLKLNLELTLKQYFSSDASMGLEALKTLRVCLSSNVRSLAAFKKLHDDLYIAIKRHRLLKQYLEIFHEYSSHIDVSSEIVLLNADIEVWDTILMLALKASMIDSALTRNKLVSNLNIIIEKETNLHELFKQLCKSL